MSVKQYCTHRHGLNEFSRNKYAVIELFNTPQNYNVSGYRIDVDLANMFANFDDLTLGNNFSNSNGTVIAGNQNELVLTSNEIGCVFDGDEGDIILPLGTYRISVNMSVYSASITTTMFTYLRKNSVLTGPYQYEAFTNNRDDQIGFENIVTSNIDIFNVGFTFNGGSLSLAHFNINSVYILIEKIDCYL